MQKGKRYGGINRSPGGSTGQLKGPFLEAESAAVPPETDICREAAAPGRGPERGKRARAARPRGAGNGKGTHEGVRKPRSPTGSQPGGRRKSPGRVVSGRSAPRPGPLPPVEGAPGARSNGPSGAGPSATEEGPATEASPREPAARRAQLPRPGQAGPGRALGPERGGEPEPPRGRYLDGFLQHRHPALPGLRLLLAEPGAGRLRPRLSACPGDGAARPGPCSFKLPATVTGAGGGEGRNEAGRMPRPPEAGGGNTRSACRKYPKTSAERAERLRKTAGEALPSTARRKRLG